MSWHCLLCPKEREGRREGEEIDRRSDEEGRCRLLSGGLGAGGQGTGFGMCVCGSGGGWGGVRLGLLFRPWR